MEEAYTALRYMPNLTDAGGHPDRRDTARNSHRSPAAATSVNHWSRRSSGTMPASGGIARIQHRQHHGGRGGVEEQAGHRRRRHVVEAGPPRRHRRKVRPMSLWWPGARLSIRSRTAVARSVGTPSRAADSQSVSMRQTRPPGRVTPGQFAHGPVRVGDMLENTRSLRTPSKVAVGNSRSVTLPWTKRTGRSAGSTRGRPGACRRTSPSPRPRPPVPPPRQGHAPPHPRRHRRRAAAGPAMGESASQAVRRTR